MGGISHKATEAKVRMTLMCMEGAESFSFESSPEFLNNVAQFKDGAEFEAHVFHHHLTVQQQECLAVNFLKRKKLLFTFHILLSLIKCTSVLFFSRIIPKYKSLFLFYLLDNGTDMLRKREKRRD